MCGQTFKAVKRRGVFCSQSCAGKNSGRLAPSGAAHWNWKGGGGGPYHTHAWHIVRDQVRERDGWTCVDCHRHRSLVGRLHAHHLVSREDWGDRPGHPDDPENLVTLCTGCHKRRHNKSESAVAERRRAYARDYYRKNREAKLAYDRERRLKRAAIT